MEKQPTVKNEQGKQVLAAKFAFAQHRNDSYVLVSTVVTDTQAESDRNNRLLLLLMLQTFMNGWSLTK